MGGLGKKSKGRGRGSLSSFEHRKHLRRSKLDMDPPAVHSGQHCPFTTWASVATGHGGHEGS